MRAFGEKDGADALQALAPLALRANPLEPITPSSRLGRSRLRGSNPNGKQDPMQHDSAKQDHGSEPKPLECKADIGLDVVGDSFMSCPDMVRITFHPNLVSEIARAIVGLKCMDLGYSNVTISIGDSQDLYLAGEPWCQSQEESNSGDFDVSSVWLHVYAETIAIELWDEHSDSELHGNLQIADVPGLSELIRQASNRAFDEIEARMKRLRADAIQLATQG